jgi:hypothetical protein
MLRLELIRLEMDEVEELLVGEEVWIVKTQETDSMLLKLWLEWELERRKSELFISRWLP